MIFALNGKHERPAGKAGRPGFWQIYGITVALILVVIGGVLGYLWLTLRDYEASTQNAALEELKELFTSGDYEELALRAGLAENPYESTGVREEYLRQILAGGEVSYYKITKESTSQSPVYLAQAGEQPIAEVRLIQVKEGRFGRWQPESIEMRLPVWGNVTVRLPQEAELKINGQPARDRELSARDVPYAELANLPDSVEKPRQKEYRLTGLFVQPELTITAADGRELEVSLTELSAQELTFEFEEEREAGQEQDAEKETSFETADVREHLAAAVLPPPEGDAGELEEMAINDARIYSLYLTSDYSFTSLARRMIRGSESYKNMQIMETLFYTNHYDVQFSNETTGNLRSFSPDIFSIDVDYTYTVFRAGGQREYPFDTHVTFYYVKDGADWKIGDILIR